MDIEKEREAFEAEFLKIKSDIAFWLHTWDEEMQGYNHPVMCWFWHMWQAAKATPEGFVLVPKVITDEWMSVYVDPEVSKYCKEFEGLPFAVTEKDLPMIQEDFRRPIKAAHSRLMKVIEAQEQSHELD